jgi:hypothetical protein
LKRGGDKNAVSHKTDQKGPLVVHLDYFWDFPAITALLSLKYFSPSACLQKLAFRFLSVVHNVFSLFDLSVNFILSLSTNLFFHQISKQIVTGLKTRTLKKR